MKTACMRNAGSFRGNPAAAGYPSNFLVEAEAYGLGAIRAVYDAEHSTLLDAPAGSPAVDTGAVGSVSDIGGGSQGALDQSNATERPTLAATGFLGSQPCILFDGGDVLELTGGWSGGADAQPFTIVLVAQLGSNAGTYVLAGNGAGSTVQIKAQGTTRWQVTAGTTANSTDVPDTNPHVLIAVFNGATTKLYKDGTEIISGAGGSNGLNGLAIGAANGGFFYMPSGSKIAAAAAYTGDIGAAAISYIQAAATSRWGTFT